MARRHAQKRRLTEDEIKDLRTIMANAPMGKKPSVRFFARRYGVNQPSIIKSLGGWDKVHRGSPAPPAKPTHIDTKPTPTIEPFTTQTPESLQQGAND